MTTPKQWLDSLNPSQIEAVKKLMFKLRTSQVVHDENRMQGLKGYTVTVATTLGVKVIRALEKRKWTKP